MIVTTLVMTGHRLLMTTLISFTLWIMIILEDSKSMDS